MMPSLQRSASRTLPKREDRTRATVAHKVVLPTPPAQEAKASAVPDPGARRGCGEAMRNLSLTSNAESSARRGMLLCATGTDTTASATIAGAFFASLLSAALGAANVRYRIPPMFALSNKASTSLSGPDDRELVKTHLQHLCCSAKPARSDPGKGSRRADCAFRGTTQHFQGRVR